MPLKLRWEWLRVCAIGMQAKLASPHSVSCVFISSRLTLMSTFVLMRPSPPKLLPYIVKPVAYSCFHSALSLLHHTLSHIYLNKCFFVFFYFRLAVLKSLTIALGDLVVSATTLPDCGAAVSALSWKHLLFCL